MEDNLLTVLMIAVTAIMFIIVYLVPVAGVIMGSVLLKKRPQQKGIGLTVLLISVLLCVCVAVWKTLDIIYSSRTNSHNIFIGIAAGHFI